MVVFGTVVLHEYIHWDKLVSPVIEGPFGIDSINDEAYGFWNVRRLWQADARENADSYALLATEIFWVEACEQIHGPLQEPREEDCKPLKGTAEGLDRLT